DFFKCQQNQGFMTIFRPAPPPSHGTGTRPAIPSPATDISRRLPRGKRRVPKTGPAALPSRGFPSMLSVWHILAPQLAAPRGRDAVAVCLHTDDKPMTASATRAATAPLAIAP